MGDPASSTTTDIYMQTPEHTAISAAVHPQKVWERLLMTFILLLNVRNWKSFSITSRIFIKILSLQSRRKVMEKERFFTLY